MFNCFDLYCPETNRLTMCHSVCAVLQLPHANQTKSNACLLLHTFFSFFFGEKCSTERKGSCCQPITVLMFCCSFISQCFTLHSLLDLKDFNFFDFLQLEIELKEKMDDVEGTSVTSLSLCYLIKDFPFFTFTKPTHFSEQSDSHP